MNPTTIQTTTTTIPNGTFTSFTLNGPFVGGAAGEGIGHPPASTSATVLLSSGTPSTSTFQCIYSVSLTPDGDLVIEHQ